MKYKLETKDYSANRAKIQKKPENFVGKKQNKNEKTQGIQEKLEMLIF